MRLSERLAKMEDRTAKRWSRWKGKHRQDWKLYAVLLGIGWYFYGMLINSVRLGIRQSFSGGVDSIWVVNPFRNLIAPFTLTGLGVTAALMILACLFTRKGIAWLAGDHSIHDKRGFDILQDSTHGTARFMDRREMTRVAEVGKLEALSGTVLGKYKENELDADRYADYVAASPDNGLNGNIVVIGAPGTGKSRGFVRPFVFQCVKRGESMVLTDPKSELYESMSGYLLDQGYEVRVFNLMDMAHSDAWNCIGDAEHDITLIPSIAATIIQNTSGEQEMGDFWSKAELNLLTALLYYVLLETDENGKTLPLWERRLGKILRLLSEDGLTNIDRTIRRLPTGHPAKGPYGLFLQAKENLRGNIVIGLGNRLNVFHNALVDRLTAASDIDLTLPGKKPCAYFCILSAQDSTYAFLSSLFFTLLFSRLEQTARHEGENGRLKVPVNFLLDEFPSIGKLGDFKRTIAVTRGYRMNCQVIVQSIAQLADLYPRHEWEELVACCDTCICLGAADLMSAKFISDKCGMATIRVINQQSPQLPLFSFMQTPNRPYSQTKSNTQRALLLPDEVLRLDNSQSIVLLRGQQPMLLYKIVPEEFAAYHKLRPLSIMAYDPSPQDTPPAARTGPSPSAQTDAEKYENRHTPQQNTASDASRERSKKRSEPAAMRYTICDDELINICGRLNDPPIDKNEGETAK